MRPFVITHNAHSFRRHLAQAVCARSSISAQDSLCSRRVEHWSLGKLELARWSSHLRMPTKNKNNKIKTKKDEQENGRPITCATLCNGACCWRLAIVVDVWLTIVVDISRCLVPWRVLLAKLLTKLITHHKPEFSDAPASS